MIINTRAGTVLQCAPVVCDNFSTKGFKGTPSARQVVRLGRARTASAGSIRGIALDDRGCRAVSGRGRGESRRGRAAAWPAASAWGRTARAAAAAPLPRTCHRPGHPPSRIAGAPRLDERSDRPPAPSDSVAAKGRRLSGGRGNVEAFDAQVSSQAAGVQAKAQHAAGSGDRKPNYPTFSVSVISICKPPVSPNISAGLSFQPVKVMRAVR
jgi:hypothetical protein